MDQMLPLWNFKSVIILFATFFVGFECRNLDVEGVSIVDPGRPEDFSSFREPEPTIVPDFTDASPPPPLTWSPAFSVFSPPPSSTTTAKATTVTANAFDFVSENNGTSSTAIPEENNKDTILSSLVTNVTTPSTTTTKASDLVRDGNITNPSSSSSINDEEESGRDTLPTTVSLSTLISSTTTSTTTQSPVPFDLSRNNSLSILKNSRRIEDGNDTSIEFLAPNPPPVVYIQPQLGTTSSPSSTLPTVINLTSSTSENKPVELDQFQPSSSTSTTTTTAAKPLSPWTIIGADVTSTSPTPSTTTSLSPSPTPPASLCSPVNPCENQGVCYDLGNNFTCDCKRGYSGPTCSEQYNACSRNPCENNATCITQAPSDLYVCDCPKGYSGINCEHEIDDCLGVNCTNGKVCYDLGAEYECRCPPGYTGTNCSSQIPVDHCLGINCPPGQICFDSQGSWKCDCPFGFFGPNCTVRIDNWGKLPEPSSTNNCEKLGDGIYRCQNGHCEFVQPLNLPPKGHDEEEEYINNSSHDHDQDGHEGHDTNDLSPPGSTVDPSVSATSNTSTGDVDVVFIIIVTSACLLIVIVLVLLLYSVRSVKRARATRGTYSPSAQEMFGNSASEILKPPPEERLI